MRAEAVLGVLYSSVALPGAPRGGRKTYRIDREIVDEPKSPSQSTQTMNFRSSLSLKSLFYVEAKVESSIEVSVVLQIDPGLNNSRSDFAGPSSVPFA